MKKLLFIILVASLLLFTACSSKETTTDGTISDTSDSAQPASLEDVNDLDAVSDNEVELGELI